MAETEHSSPTPLVQVISWLTCLLLSALAVSALLTGYYSHACSYAGIEWGLFIVVALLMVLPFVTIPIWCIAAFVLAKYLQPASSVSRYVTTLALSIPVSGVIFALGLLFAMMTGAVARCSFGF